MDQGKKVDVAKIKEALKELGIYSSDRMYVGNSKAIVINKFLDELLTEQQRKNESLSDLCSKAFECGVTDQAVFLEEYFGKASSDEEREKIKEFYDYGTQFKLGTQF